MPDRHDEPPHLIDMMSQFLRSQESVIRKLSQMVEHLGEVRADMRNSQRQVAIMRQDMAGVNAELAGGRVEMASMRSEMAALRTDFAAVRTDVASLRTDVATLRTETSTSIAALRADMLSRFEAVGVRFDDQDAALERLESGVNSARIDIAALDISIVNALDSALQAHRRLDEGGASA